MTSQTHEAHPDHCLVSWKRANLYTAEVYLHVKAMAQNSLTALVLSCFWNVSPSETQPTECFCLQEVHLSSSTSHHFPNFLFLFHTLLGSLLVSLHYRIPVLCWLFTSSILPGSTILILINSKIKTVIRTKLKCCRIIFSIMKLPATVISFFLLHMQEFRMT